MKKNSIYSTYISLVISIAVAMQLVSCKTQLPITNFIKYQTQIDSLTIAALDPVIQKNDIISVNISAPGSENTQRLVQLYNGTAGMAGGQSSLATQGYLVSPMNGTITIPSLGEVEVAGKTKQEIVNIIYQKLKVRLEVGPVVTVRILNFRVYLEGEITRPGIIDVPNEVLTLPQALSIAGGTTLYATLSDIEILRTENGKQRIVHIDLRNDEIFTTKKEFYYLKQGDYIAIKPNKEKIASTNQSTARSISYATTAITILLAMFTIFGTNGR